MSVIVAMNEAPVKLIQERLRADLLSVERRMLTLPRCAPARKISLTGVIIY